jgi:hypothetical protein
VESGFTSFQIGLHQAGDRTLTVDYQVSTILSFYIFVDKKNRFEARTLGRTVTKLSTCDTDTI